MLDIQLEQMFSSQIEHRSFELIQQELDHVEIRLGPENELVTKRAIHATVDFGYTDSLVFSSYAVKKGTEALKQGTVTITDTNMGKSRISKRVASTLGAEVLYFTTDRGIAREVRGRKCTRAVANIKKAVRLFGAPEGTRPCILTIGSTPTALVWLYELVKEGRIRSSLITGAPVGFVDMAQSEGLVLTSEDTPYTVARERKGGSSVAIAICSALLYQIK